MVKPTTTKQIAKEALKLAKDNKKKIPTVEWKSLTSSFPTDPFDTTAINSLSDIAAGDTLDDRSGEKVKAKSLRVKGNIEGHGSAATTIVWLMIIIDLMAAGSAPVIGDLFDSDAAFYSNRNKKGDPQVSSRFIVLWDKYFCLSNTGNQRVAFDKYIPLRHNIVYTGTAATNRGKGAIYLLSGSSRNTNRPVMSADAMLKYTDG